MNDVAGRSAAEVARAYFDAQNRHDIDGLMALFGEDGAFTSCSPSDDYYASH